jgi:hypothetical protein
MYKQCKPIFEGSEISSIIRLSDGACIPLHPDNTDFQEFIRLLHESRVNKATGKADNGFKLFNAEDDTEVDIDTLKQLEQKYYLGQREWVNSQQF